MADASAEWDPVTTNNDRDARTFLRNSLTQAVWNRLHDQLLDRDNTFAVWLLVLIRLDESTSIHRYNNLKDQLRFLRLQQFPAQNVVQFVVKAQAIHKELFSTNQCDELITRDVVNNPMQQGGGHQQWICILMPILIALEGDPAENWPCVWGRSEDPSIAA